MSAFTRTPYIVLTLTLIIFLAGCALEKADGLDNGVMCTDEFRFGLGIYVQSADPGFSLDGLVITVRDGAYEEMGQWNGTGSVSINGEPSANAFQYNPNEKRASLAAAGERAGSYDITISHPKYKTVTRAGVKVEADNCHVHGQTFTFELHPVR